MRNATMMWALSLALLLGIGGSAAAASGAGARSGSRSSGEVTAANFKEHQQRKKDASKSREKAERKQTRGIAKAIERSISKRDPDVRRLLSILKDNGYESIKLARLSHEGDGFNSWVILTRGFWGRPSLKLAKPVNRLWKTSSEGDLFFDLERINVVDAQRIEKLDLTKAIREVLEAANREPESQFRAERVASSYQGNGRPIF
jgi:hypothetical protein